MKILVFAASLKKDSLNKKLSAQAAEILKTQPNLTIDLANFQEFEMPMYDGDLEESSGIPSGAQELIRRIQASDAILISTPEYNGGIPGTLKNAIDWASRSRPTPFTGKHILLLGASPGGFGAVRGLAHTRIPLETLGAYVYPQMFGVPRAHEAFDESSKFKDPKQLDHLTKLIGAFVKFAQAR
ncbi:MAG: NAD(P)H-dependent oxidoreductase [Xanthomonadaceae bacterium]|nr:NAD(P)H-dependent oxidoreductase [Xanthomonadaceae bacterium]